MWKWRVAERVGPKAPPSFLHNIHIIFLNCNLLIILFPLPPTLSYLLFKHWDSRNPYFASTSSTIDDLSPRLIISFTSFRQLPWEVPDTFQVLPPLFSLRGAFCLCSLWRIEHLWAGSWLPASGASSVFELSAPPNFCLHPTSRFPYFCSVILKYDGRLNRATIKFVWENDQDETKQWS